MRQAEAGDTLFLSPGAERLFQIGSFEWSILTNEVKWSDGLFLIYGLEPQQFGATLEAFMERVVPEDRAHVQAAIQNAIESRGSFSCVERIVHSSGEIRYVESKGEILVNDNGDPTKLIGLCRDISDKKRLEIRLQTSQKLEAIGRLAAGVAHDFNNLLTVIKLNAELIELKTRSKENRPLASAIQEAASRASDLTSQLLMFGQKGKSKRHVIELNNHVADSKHLLTSLLGDRVVLNLNLCDGPSYIDVDPSQLDQVLVNLAVNAREAMPNGGAFSVSTIVEQVSENSLEAHEISEGEYVVVVVSDSGNGMSREECKHAFEPFFSDKPMGTGLGLSVVYGIVKSCDGLVQLTSEPGAGTTFRIFFPLAKPESSLEATDDSKRVGSDGGRILVVDDESSVRSVVQQALEQSGYEVLSADSGQKALDLLESINGQIDLLLTDVVMPEMTGPELASAALEEFQELPVLYISGYNDDFMGAVKQHELLLKPFSIQQLLKRVRAVLSVI